MNDDAQVTPLVNYADWNINLAGQQGQQGSTGPASISDAPNDGYLYGRVSLGWSSGGTLSQNLLISQANPGLYLNKAASGDVAQVQSQMNGAPRWSMHFGNNTAESGSNAGSDFALYRHDDAGNPIDVPLGINRATGNATFADGITVNSGGVASSQPTNYMSLTLRNSTASLSKYFRVSAAGALEIINNANSIVITTLDDSGNFATAGSATAAQFVINANNLMLTDGTNLLTRTGGAFYVQNPAGNVNYADIANGNASFNGSLTVTTAVYLKDANNWFVSDGTSLFARTSGNFYVQNTAGTVSYGQILNGTAQFNGSVVAGYNFIPPSGANGGYRCKQGDNNALGGNYFNLYWLSPNVGVYVDNSYLGNLTFTSDYRTKKDIAELPSMWQTVRALRPIKYTHAEFSPPSHFKKTPEGDDMKPMFAADDIERWGFIAHELQEVTIDSAASCPKDAHNAIQSPNPWTVIAALTKALQEAMARIEALEAK